MNKMKSENVLVNSAKIVGLMGGLCLFFSIGIPILNNFAIRYTPKIKTKNQLENSLIEEKKNLKIENKDIRILYSVNRESSFSRKEDGFYLIGLIEGQESIGVLRHELYHIARGHCDEEERFIEAGNFNLMYTFIYEPQATIYSLTGIKL